MSIYICLETTTVMPSSAPTLRPPACEIIRMGCDCDMSSVSCNQLNQNTEDGYFWGTYYATTEYHNGYQNELFCLLPFLFHRILKLFYTRKTTMLSLSEKSFKW